MDSAANAGVGKRAAAVLDRSAVRDHLMPRTVHIIGAGLGGLPDELRRRIASVVLMVPGRDIYFHANPTGIFYAGPTDASPDHTIPLLRGLPVTCIYGADETDSLCEAPAMASARRVEIDDGHLMLWSHRQLSQALLQAIANPPRPFV